MSSARFFELHIPNNFFGNFWIPGENNFFPDLPDEERIFILGMLDACPEPKTMIKTFSLEWIIRRYSECNLVGAFIIEKAKEINPDLAEQLLAKRSREDDELPQYFEKEAVPSDYVKNLYPGSSITGYAASRILIEQFGRENKEEKRENWKIGDERVKRGFAILQTALKTTSKPINFLIRLAKLVSEADADPTAVLGHLLAVELKNEGSYTQIREIITVLPSLAPELWQHYLSLSEKEKESARILTLSYFTK